MKKSPVLFSGIFLLAFLFGSGTSGPQISSPGGPASPPRVESAFGKIPLQFIPNVGQMDGPAAFYVQGRDKLIYFAPDGLTFHLIGPSPSERWAVKLDFVDANPDAKPVGVEESGTLISYFKGRPEEWKTGLPAYSKIVYEDLWPGIDLVYSGTVDRMKYEFLVEPGADPSKIQLSYRGASAVDVTDDGRLAVTTPLGGFEDDVPIAWQDGEETRRDIRVSYAVRPTEEAGSENRIYAYGFDVGEYDHGRPLVLDPSILVYCGYIGGSSYDYGYGIAVDESGSAYVTGETGSLSATFPVVAGPDASHNGSADIFVAKVNAAGTALLYCGYIGGSGNDVGYGIAVNASGIAFITGDTTSDESTFPVLYGPDKTHNGSADVFVAKVNPAGTALLYCGYIGGSGDERGSAIAVNVIGNAYITGHVYESSAGSFPVVNGPDWTQHGGVDAFVAKVDFSSTELVYCGYLGGLYNDYGFGIALDGSGNAYVTGYTGSWAFPAAVGPDLSYNGGLYDAFITKVDTRGMIQYSGYIGGSGIEYGKSIAVDASGNAYVTGYTGSAQSSFPVAVGPDLAYNGGSWDVFVAKVNAAGTGLLYCGYIGGSGDDVGNGIALDSSGNAYITGYTDSSEATFPVVSGPDLNYNGVEDVFIAKVNAAGTALSSCGYIGGSSTDNGYGIAVDGSGNAYVTGATISTGASFPVVVGPDNTHNGSSDAFVAKISFSADVLALTAPNGGESWAVGAVQNIVWTTTGTVANVKLEYSTDGGTSWTTIVASTANTGTYAWTVPSASSTNCLIRVSEASTGTPSDVSNAAFSISTYAPPTIQLSKSTLNFGGSDGITTASQPVFINNSGGGTLTWTAVPSVAWITVTPGSGTGPATIQIGVNTAGLSGGAYAGTVSVAATGATNTPQLITVNLRVYDGSNPPIGVVDTPTDNTAGIEGSVPVTGWAVDDIGVENVKVYRDPVAGEGAGPNGYVYIGDAVFVEGARPDIEQAYPNFPLNTRAGWGYMMLTNFLPNQGNGTFVIHAIAADKEGNTTLLGSKRITCDNANAVLPFGAMDVPSQGGTASGNAYRNFAWVLATKGKCIPVDGSTIWAYVDGAPIGHPKYSYYRVDIATLFPGFCNADAAIGYIDIDTTKYANSVHTIVWSATDNAGVNNGFGSRYFTIQNSASGVEEKSPLTPLYERGGEQGDRSYPPLFKRGEWGDFRAELDSRAVSSLDPIYLRRGYDRKALSAAVYPDQDGTIRVEIRELERLEIRLNENPVFSTDRYCGYLKVGDELRPLPIGSSIDLQAGVFAWTPGPGFIGEYEFVFVGEYLGRMRKIPVKVTIRPRFSPGR